VPVVAGVLLGVAILLAAVLYANSGTRSVPHAAPGPPGTVTVSLTEMRMTPSTVTATRGQHLMLRVVNGGTMRHDLRLSNGEQTPLLAPGGSAVLDAGTITAPLSGWCTVAGHRMAGMTMTITLGTKPPQRSGTDTDMGMGATGGDSGQDAVAPDLAAAPGAGWRAPDAALPPVPAGTVHEVTWYMRDVVSEVAPGVRQQLWTFDGGVPGPVLHGRVGDTFAITVRNDTTMTHNLDLHVESGPPAAVMAPIAPGGTHTYRFVARYAGAWLYHCGTMPMLQHMANGMYGALIVDPPDLAPVAQQYVLVGSELFFGPDGASGDYAKMRADQPDAVVFNGYPFAYQHQPLTATAGAPIRIWVVAAGPNRGLSFHVVGAPFTAAYLGGTYLLRPGDPARGAAQTLSVAPGDGGFVELTVERAGTYPFLTHDMADAELGAAGSITATD